LLPNIVLSAQNKAFWFACARATTFGAEADRCIPPFDRLWGLDPIVIEVEANDREKGSYF
jgi:hypothetical protein